MIGDTYIAKIVPFQVVLWDLYKDILKVERRDSLLRVLEASVILWGYSFKRSRTGPVCHAPSGKVDLSHRAMR